MKGLTLSFFASFALVTAAHAQFTNGALLDDTLIHTIELTFTQPNYWQQLGDNKSADDANGSSTYIPAAVMMDGVALDSVGVQFKGNASYYNYPGNKKPFTLSFDEYIDTQKVDGLSSLNLNNGYQDPTMLREKMFLDFCQQIGAAAPRMNYAKLFINGTYWGLYLMCERVNKTFCKQRFDNKSGNLYKGDGTSASCANLEYHGVMSPYYNCYTKRTNDSVNDWTDLVNLTYLINQTSDQQFRDTLDDAMNVQRFIDAWAAYNLMADFDSYPYRFKHNYYLYRNADDDRFEWIVWDVSTAFGMDIPMTVSQIENISVLYLTPPAEGAPLCNRMLADSVFKNQYLQTVCSLVNTYFIPSVLNEKVDVLSNRIRDDYYNDTQKMYTNQQFEDNLIGSINTGSQIPGLKTFINSRYASVTSELTTLGITCSTTTSVASATKAFMLEVFPNPTTNYWNVQLQTNDLVEWRLTDVTGREIQNVTNPSSNFLSIDATPLPQGIYFLSLQQLGATFNVKLVKQ